MDTEHTTLHVALETAINHVLPCGEINIVQSPKYITHNDGTTIGSGFKATYIKKACNNYSMTLSWDAPTEREDGTPLDGIGGYLLSVNDKLTTLPPNTLQYTLNGLSSGAFEVKIATIDQSNRQSIWESLTLILR